MKYVSYRTETPLATRHADSARVLAQRVSKNACVHSAPESGAVGLVCVWGGGGNEQRRVRA